MSLCRILHKTIYNMLYSHKWTIVAVQNALALPSTSLAHFRIASKTVILLGADLPGGSFPDL